MLEVAVGVEVETDRDRYDLRIGHHCAFGGVSLHPQKRKGRFSTSLLQILLQKSSAIQKISVTLLSVIVISYLLFGSSKLLNISDITKRIGNFFKLLILLFILLLIPNSRYEEPVAEMQWKVVEDSTKTLLGYECLMAIADYHGLQVDGTVFA